MQKIKKKNSLVSSLDKKNILKNVWVKFIISDLYEWYN